MQSVDGAVVAQLPAGHHVAGNVSAVRQVLNEAVPGLSGTWVPVVSDHICMDLMRPWPSPIGSRQYLSPKLVQSALDTISCMVTAPPGADVGEKTERWEIANRRNFGESGGYEVLRSLMVQYSAEDNRSTEKDSILLNVVLLFHLTLVSRRATTDFLTCSQVGSRCSGYPLQLVV